MAQFVKTFSITDGVIASEITPDSPEGLYASPQELNQLFGCTGITEEDVRFAMGLIHTFTNRRTLWPSEYIEGPYEIPFGRMETRLHQTPVISILECAGRFSLQRRDRQGWNNMYNAWNPLLILSGTGIPQWTPLATHLVEFDPPTGIVYLPLSSMLLPYSLVRLRTIAGFISIPFSVKRALVELINTTHAKGVSDRVKYSVGRISRTYTSDSFISPLAKQMLSPLVVQAHF